MTLIIVLAILIIGLGYYTKRLNDKNDYNCYMALAAASTLTFFLLIAVLHEILC